jgi:hypothetical protein
VKKILMTVKELSGELGISEKSIRRAYWKGQLPAERICRMILFDLEVVRQVMRANGSPQKRAKGPCGSAPADRTGPACAPGE